ncbi:MAG: Hsp70 family protein, partial [Myxococcota bacterium]
MTEKTPILGIDFGTSNTAAAWVDGHDRVRVVAVREGVHLLPTVAWYNERGSVLVGDAANQQLQDDPTHTIHGLKRFIGRRWTSPFVHRHKGTVGYRLAEAADGLVGVDLFGKVKPLEDVAVDIFRRIVELASASMRVPAQGCVLTVPAHFGYSQRHVIRRAANRAGLDVKGMVNEPTAAAMYYARKKGDDGRVLIFDLGGGTFDATLLAVMGGVVRVLATGGDAFLGGKDFDHALASSLADRFAADHGVSLAEQRVSLWRLLLAAEQAKVRLSAELSTEIRVPAIAAQGDRFVDLQYTVTRRELESLTAGLVEKCVGICSDILRRAELTAADVDEIVFVGGQTRMPEVQRRLGQIFKTHPSKHIHPDLGVAVGAALLARGEQRLIDVTSAPLGIMIPGVGARELIPANTTVPSVKRLSLGVRPRPGQPLNLAIYELPDAQSLEREHLGTLRADGGWIEQHPGDLELEAWLGDDLEVTLSLRAADGERLPLQIDRP